jgi:hypothetical protein
MNSTTKNTIKATCKKCIQPTEYYAAEVTKKKEEAPL